MNDELVRGIAAWIPVDDKRASPPWMHRYFEVAGIGVDLVADPRGKPVSVAVYVRNLEEIVKLADRLWSGFCLQWFALGWAMVVGSSDGT